MAEEQPSRAKVSNRSHWESFWESKQEVQEVYSNEERIVRNLTAVTSLRGKKVLEVGAGTGRDSFPLVRHGAQVYQIDNAEHSLRILKQLGEQSNIRVSILGGDAFRLPFRNETFDVVLHQGLLEHFRKPQADALLQENIRVLKKNGLLLVDVPQRYHIYTIAKHILIAFNAWFAGWERSFSIRELQALLMKQGITVVHAYGEWMYPSFLYRVAREVFKKFGMKLPLRPQLFQPLTRLRESLRLVLLNTPLPLYTGISIGVIARK